MEFTLSSSTLLLKIVNSIKLLTEDVIFLFTKDGMKFETMDTMHTALCCLFIPTSDFDSYTCDDKSYNVGLHVESLSRVLSMATKNESITWKCICKNDETEPSSVEIIFQSEKDQTFHKYKLSLMDMDQDAVDIPDIDFSYVAELNSKDFKANIGNLCKVGDECTFNVTDSVIELSSKPSDVSIGVSSMMKILYQNLHPSGSGPFHGTFSSEYIKRFTRASPLSDNVIISMSHDMPIQINYGYITYYLAPKFDNNESDDVE